VTYIIPNEVVSPKQSWTLKRVVYNSGSGGWSAAEGIWEGSDCLALRWNGSANDTGVGSPQSRGYPTWFIVPDELKGSLYEEISALDKVPPVTFEIVRPDSYDFGAWRVVAKLRSDIEYKSLTFCMPSLPKRMFQADTQYRNVVAGELHGRFSEGEWHADLYTNGVSEDLNPTSIAAVEEELVQNVMRALHLLEVS
jgi:hypothetical protein